MGKQEALDYIWGITDRDDLTEVLNVARKRSKQLEEQEANAFGVGDRVEFTDKWGKKQTGTVTKINQRTVSLDADTGVSWRVSPRFLTKITGTT